jgi:Icc-related predicted phosphoesterase
MARINVACTSDTHGMIDEVFANCFGNDRIAKPDVMVFAGDVAPSDFGVVASDYIRKVFFEAVRKHPETEFVYTPGNHDFFAQQWDKFEKDVPRNFHFLLDGDCEICGLRFYGSPWVPYINGCWAFECDDEDELYDLFGLIPSHVDVLVTHSPPRIRHEQIDVSLQFEGGSRPFGSQALYENIVSKKPRYEVCGHIHSGDHSEIDIPHGDGSFTACFNVSHVDERYFPTYKPTIISIEV